jgi:membrane dipeptidase
MPPRVSRELGRRTAEALLRVARQVEEQSSGSFRWVKTYAELEHCWQAGVTAGALHFEGAEPVDPEGDDLACWHKAGIRSVGPVWSRPNAFGNGVPLAYPASPDEGLGLTPEGKNLIKEAARLGMLVDLAHVNEKGFWDVAELAVTPLVSTHTGSHKLSQTARNLTDRQAKGVAETGGVIGITFAINDLRGTDKLDADITLDRVADHFAYFSDLIGPQHVAFGSDWDGTSVPSELESAENLPRLVERLSRRGFSNAELTGLCHGNWFRLLKRVWRGCAD